jgi:VWFA-related protein
MAARFPRFPASPGEAGTPIPVARRRAASAIGISAVAACLLCLLGSLPGATAQETESAELTTRESDTTFKVQVQRNVVLVRAVVRDTKGQTVGNLRKEDFRVFDNGKPQTISHFAAEVPASKVRELPTPAEEEPEPEALSETVLAPSTPERYVGLFFDDIHMKFEDVARTREAAERHLATALQPGDRVGIFTSSGRHVIDFTDDRGKLHETLLQLFPSPIVPKRENACPQISDYQAYLIVLHRDPIATEIATGEAYYCFFDNPDIPTTAALASAKDMAESEAMSSLNGFQTEIAMTLRNLDHLVRRMAATPGQRSIVLISPGFLMLTAEQQVDEIVERALRANVVINTLDAKGLYVPVGLGDASQRQLLAASSADLMGKKQRLASDEIKMAGDVLFNLAHDTGGVSFQNSNDLDEGFRRVGSLPEVYYVLGFSPQNLKLDGRVHTLKVSLSTRERYTIQARRGYYAPRQPADATVQAKEEIEQAVFSHDELNELPVEVHTQFFKLNNLDARLSVVTRLDLRFVHFRKESGRNLDNVTLITALFDRDGKYVAGKEKKLEFRLLDGTLERLSRSGITAKTNFDVKAGTYLVRQVVRDSEGAQLSALNRTVEIPF